MWFSDNTKHGAEKKIDVESISGHLELQNVSISRNSPKSNESVLYYHLSPLIVSHEMDLFDLFYNINPRCVCEKIFPKSTAVHKVTFLV